MTDLSGDVLSMEPLEHTHDNDPDCVCDECWGADDNPDGEACPHGRHDLCEDCLLASFEETGQ